jgi:hypothetical protein
MKKYPECSRTYPDILAFCVEDGATLSVSFESEPTLVLPATLSLITDKSSARLPTRSLFLYVVILILLILVVGGGVALLYERGKSAPLASNIKPSEIANPISDLNGEWELVNTIESSSDTSYVNAKVTFRLFIKQVGEEFTADGKKVWITGRVLESNEHTPIIEMDLPCSQFLPLLRFIVE